MFASYTKKLSLNFEQFLCKKWTIELIFYWSDGFSMKASCYLSLCKPHLLGIFFKGSKVSKFLKLRLFVLNIYYSLKKFSIISLYFKIFTVRLDTDKLSRINLSYFTKFKSSLILIKHLKIITKLKCFRDPC